MVRSLESGMTKNAKFSDVITTLGDNYLSSHSIERYAVSTTNNDIKTRNMSSKVDDWADRGNARLKKITVEHELTCQENKMLKAKVADFEANNSFLKRQLEIQSTRAKSFANRLKNSIKHQNKQTSSTKKLSRHVTNYKTQIHKTSKANFKLNEVLRAYKHAHKGLTQEHIMTLEKSQMQSKQILKMQNIIIGFKSQESLWSLKLISRLFSKKSKIPILS